MLMSLGVVNVDIVSLEGVVARAEGEASEGGSPFESAASRRSGIILRSAVTVGDAAPRGGPSDGAERAKPDGEEVDAPAVRDGHTRLDRQIHAYAVVAYHVADFPDALASRLAEF